MVSHIHEQLNLIMIDYNPFFAVTPFFELLLIFYVHFDDSEIEKHKKLIRQIGPGALVALGDSTLSFFLTR